MIVQRKQYLSIQNFMLNLQSCSRAIVVRSTFQKKTKAAITIQRYERSCLKNKQTSTIDF
ncbi:hypothetical protein T08_13667 [Trichinella sp. T8]|nr:hypothetical protein T08_13667 [Trichinella sp. T8]